MTTRDHVSGGFCIMSDGISLWKNESFCVLESTQCPDFSPHFTFRSARETEDLDVGGYRNCLNSLNPDLSRSSRMVHLGKCGENKCASDQASCDNTYGEYIPVRAGSFYQECQANDVLYGDCNGRCVWSSNECKEGEQYTLPLMLYNDTFIPKETDCTCDKVRVGGCKNKGDRPVHCAVSADSCDYTQTWLSPQEVVEQENVDCFLCLEPPTPRPSNVPSPPTPSPISSPTSSPVKPVTTKPTLSSVIEETLLKPNETESSSNKGLIIGGVAGGIVGIAVPIIAVLYLFRKRRNEKEKHPPPPRTFNAANVQGVVMDDEELSFT